VRQSVAHLLHRRHLLLGRNALTVAPIAARISGVVVTAQATKLMSAKGAAVAPQTPQAAKTTLFAAGNEADICEKRRRRLFANR
jgi:hypothetical protein